MDSELEHGDFMRQALELASQNLKRPFACVIVDRVNGEVVARGLNKNHKNPVMHAEIVAITALVREHGEDARWGDYTLYTTAEPNAMNMAAILWTGIPEVVHGTSLATLSSLGYRNIDIPAREVVARARALPCRLVPGVLEKECDALFAAAAKLDKKLKA
jgi:tRNA(Arg) A34 adenosine deaminase TadA